ncbi:MAG: leucine-rich repeat domain-containing protein [Bacteroidota bacterium]
MKNIKYFTVLFLLLVSNSVFTQEIYTVYYPPATDSILLNKQIQNGNLDLREIDNFPFDKIYSKNKNITSLKIQSSYKLDKLTENINKFKSLNYVEISNVKLSEFPVGLCYIDGLTTLYYSSTQTTHIPNEIGKLKNLKILRFEIIPIKEIPKEIGNLKNLEELSIVNTWGRWIIADVGFNLEGVNYLPKEIGQLKALKKLSLAKNNLIEIPKEVGLLSNLVYISLYGNNLKKIPIEIYNLQNLEELDLSSNSLENIPEEIGNLKKLEVLNLYNTKLKTLPKSIKNLKNLKRLIVEKNEISETELIELKKELPNTEIYNGKIIK